MRFKPRAIAAVVALVVMGAGGVSPASAQFGVVYDPTNFAKNAITALNSAKAVAQQIQQYQLQIQQYQNMVRNSIAPAAYVWNQAQSTINGLRTSVNQLEQLKAQAGGANQLLSQFRDTNYYRSSPCYSGSGCTAVQQAAFNSAQEAKKAAILATNADVIRGMDNRQAQLTSDANMLENLQTGATGAQGQMEALGYANQLASAQTNQLLQINGLLLAQQSAGALAAQAAADEQALQLAEYQRQRTPPPVNATPNRAY